VCHTAQIKQKSQLIQAENILNVPELKRVFHMKITVQAELSFNFLWMILLCCWVLFPAHWYGLSVSWILGFFEIPLNS
jgi:hypothetical protein